MDQPGNGCGIPGRISSHVLPSHPIPYGLRLVAFLYADKLLKHVYVDFPFPVPCCPEKVGDLTCQSTSLHRMATGQWA